MEDETLERTVQQGPSPGLEMMLLLTFPDPKMLTSVVETSNFPRGLDPSHQNPCRAQEDTASPPISPQATLALRMLEMASATVMTSPGGLRPGSCGVFRWLSPLRARPGHSG